MSETTFELLQEVRNRIKSIKDERYRFAFMYQYLIGGDPGEVAGFNSPKGSDAFKIEYAINGRKIHAVLFIVKTVRKVEHYRACVIPLDPIYEPWSLVVYKWFNKYKDECPFQFGKKKKLDAESNKDYLMRKAKKVFSGLKWLKESYTTSKKKQRRRLVEFTSSQLRDLRHSVLKELYGFNEIDLAYYGAWKDISINTQINQTVEGVLDTKFDKYDKLRFKQIGESYIKKLMIRYEQLERVRQALDIRYSLDLTIRFEKARRICTLIQDINGVSYMKLNKSMLFRENMGLILDIINECNNEPQLKSNITDISTLFEVDLTNLKRIVLDADNKKLIKLFETILIENSIEYNQKLIDAWEHMVLFRNYYNHPKDTEKLHKVLTFYNEPISLPITYSRIWEKILNKFEDSLEQCLSLINQLNAFT